MKIAAFLILGVIAITLFSGCLGAKDTATTSEDTTEPAEGEITPEEQVDEQIESEIVPETEEIDLGDMF